ncbi:MAG: amidohydrolase [Oscillibacter sp.]|nr:amidohydrolase [Oscillibacter sp.]
MKELLAKAKAIESQIAADRRYLHQIPEFGVSTPQTAAYVAQRLTEMGIANHPCGIHKPEDRQVAVLSGSPDTPHSTGVVGLIGKSGPCFLLRADMDGLPLTEETGLPYASQNGCMHACGHDAHAAMLLGAAQLLKDMEDQLPGQVKLMFQPGEEMGYGSRTMVEDGLLENPKVEAAMALHVWSETEAGKLRYCPTVTSGSMATFYILIQGKGGHSSEPQKTVDPLMIANELSTALNLIIPREVDPDQFATLTVGVIRSGTASNIIPDTAEMAVSIRTLTPEIYEHLLKRVPEVVEGYVKAWRGDYKLYVHKTPGTVCDAVLSAELKDYAGEILGTENVTVSPPMKGAEDFGWVSRCVPGFFGFLGAGGPGNYPMHNPRMTIDETALPLGAAVLANCAAEWLTARRQQAVLDV